MALIAGNGELPMLLAKAALGEKVDLHCIAITSKAYINMRDIVPTYKYSPIEVFKILDQLNKLKITDITFIGKIPKIEFFKNLHKMDLRIIEAVKKLPDLNDSSIHLNLLKYAENEYGLKVIDQSKYLKHLFPTEQIFSERKPTQEELEEIKFGMCIAKEMGRLDIGQTVVVKNKSVLAVEAMEGTNECIKRARKLLGFFVKDKSITVCKASKPGQDPRFDLPTIGLETLKTAGKNSIIAFESGKTFFVNQKESIDYANRKNICLMAC